MKVSVVIPAFNEEAYLSRCLASIKDQIEAPDEIIVVDNNSTDKTVEIAERFGAKVVSEKKQGMIHARNRGFNTAQYEIIARTDADTVVHRDWIKKIKKGFTNKKLVGLSGPAYYAASPDDVIRGASLPTKAFFQSLKQVLGHDSLFGPNMAVRKSAWEQIKDTVCLNDKKVHEDIDLAIHLAPTGKIKFDNRLTVTSSSRRWKQVKPYFEYSYRSLKMLREHNITFFEHAGKTIARKMFPKTITKQLTP